MATIKSSNINITDLDFEEVSTSLKEYLKGQDTLKDYDFEGSNLAILTDLLAYSAHTSAFNANMVASEMFLDTAQIRKNVVSRAKELGYTPASRAAAKATFDLTINSPTSLQPICSNIITPDKITEPGLTLSKSAYLGAVPWVASKIALPVIKFILAPGDIPIPPTWAANASDI